MEGKRLSEEELLKFFKDEYKANPGERTVCSYIIEHERYDKYQRLDICHARAFPSPDNTHAYGKAIAIHSSIWRSNETTKPYIEWIFDPATSPWRKVLKDFRLYRNDAGHIIGFSLLDLDVPYRTIMNFLFASRFHSEKRDKLDIWFAAQKEGLDKPAAFALAHGLTQLKKDWYTFNRYNDSHVAVYPTDYNLPNTIYGHSPFATCISRLREGDPVDTSPPYWKGKRSQAEVNSIWFDWNRPPKVNLFNITDNVRPPYKGRFPRCFTAMRDQIGIDLAPPNKDGVQVTLKTIVERQQEWIS